LPEAGSDQDARDVQTTFSKSFVATFSAAGDDKAEAKHGAAVG
jgi:hypothetical protein